MHASEYPSRTCSVLFIGGGADGQRRPDHESPYCKVAGAAPVPRADHDYSKPFEYVRNEDVYRRERLRSGREEWVIYVLDSLTTEQAMGKLVCGYSHLNDQVEARRERDASDDSPKDTNMKTDPKKHNGIPE